MKNLLNRLVLALLFISAIAVLVLSVYIGFMMNNVFAFLNEDIEARLRSDARSASLIVSAEELERFQTAEDMDDPAYAELKQRLVEFAQDIDVEYVYCYRLAPDGQVQPIIDNDLTEDSYSLATQPFPNEPTAEQAFEGQIAATVLHSYSPDYEGLLSAYAPIRDKTGTVVAIAGVDISDEQVVVTNDQINILTVLLFICVVFTLIGALLNVILQIRRQRDLELQIRQQNLLNSITQSILIKGQSSDVVTDALSQIGGFLDVDRVVIVKDESEYPCLPLFSWYAFDDQDRDGVVSTSVLSTAAMPSTALLAPTPPEYPQAVFASFPQKLPGNGEIPMVIVNDVQTADAQNAHTKDTSSAQNPAFTNEATNAQLTNRVVAVRSYIRAPLYIEGDLWGLLSIESLRHLHTWTANDLQFIKPVTNTVAGLVTRAIIERERTNALDHAIAASQAKSDFLSNISHEMRTPMNAIIGMANIGGEATEIERKDYCLSRITEASQQLLGIINDVLDMSKIESNKLELSAIPFSFESVLHSALIVSRYNLSERGLSLTVENDPNIPPVLVGDNQRLSQVITNLLSNAVKFTSEGGRIALTAQLLNIEDNQALLQISVKDNGIGISEEQQSRLFTAFEQADSTITRKYGGTGLGLAISKRIVELMGGSIWVDSELGKGSVFNFTVQLGIGDADELAAFQHSDLSTAGTLNLPAVASDGKDLDSQPGKPLVLPASTGEDIQVVQNAKTTELPNYSGLHILLAEDIEVNREIALALLEPTGVAVETATNGQEALDQFLANPHHFDLILMDIQMPVLDGLEATRRIRSHTEIANAATIPIVALTANVFKEDVEKSLAAGMNGHLGKPLNRDAVLAELARFL